MNSNQEAPSNAPRVVRVAVPVPLHQLYDYSVPDSLPLPAPGARVTVQFGRQRLTGVCVEHNPADAHDKLRPIADVLDNEPALPADLYDLALWLADYYQHPLGEVLATILPAEARRGRPLEIQRSEVWSATGHSADLKRAPRQQALLDCLSAAGGSASAAALREAGFSRALVKAAAGKGLIARLETAPDIATQVCEEPLALNPEQAAALAALESRPAGFAPTLLEGITGSGKTEIYLQLIQRLRNRGRQVLVLVPEIALTPQTVGRFERRFGGSGAVASLHSNLTDRERLQTWLRCRNGEISVLIGTRSAVLAPFRDLGLIVVDEEHDGSFKQQDGLRYSARDVAVKRAQGLGIGLLLGTATPSLESLNNAHAGRYAHLRLQHRVAGASLPGFHLIDIRGQTLQDGISDELARILKRHLDQGGQTLVFLNRRGFAPSYLCARCGWQAVCGQCEMRMTLHLSPRVLICHHCSQRQPLPRACPECAREQLIAVGVGTQRTEVGLARLFPDIPLYRIDRDTTRSQKRMEAQFASIREGQPAILLGTQMLAKGHHFPKVTLVAVINADSGFMSADFRAPERTAQLITQVAGRAGRAENPGEVWIQTYQPDGALLRSLIDNGYPGFAERELAIRKTAGLPPYRPMALVRAESANADAAREHLAALSRQLGKPLEVLGPAPAPVARVANRFRFQLLVLADSRAALHRGVAVLRAIQPATGVRWSLDIDPYDTF
ncbi:MAG: primosomal protein N' [Gammaproteobacteria bacterium]|nr:primosomal protein N' [Gammaproteobacteria bacterium]